MLYLPASALSRSMASRALMGSGELLARVDTGFPPGDRLSLPVQSNSAVAEFDTLGAEIGQARFRMEGRVGCFHKLSAREPHPGPPRSRGGRSATLRRFG